MRKVVRQVGFEEPTRVLEDNNESNFEKEPTVRVSDIAKEKNTIHGHDVGVKDSYSFASVLQHKHTKKTVAVSELRNNERVDGAAVVIPMEAVKEFSTREGMEKVLESGPWVLIEMMAEVALMDSLVVATPFTNGKGHSLDTIEVEYEWRPPRCVTCCIFDHTDEKCSKLVKEVKSTSTSQVDEEGFVMVSRKKGGAKVPPKKQLVGVRLTKPKPNMGPNPSQNEKGMELKNSFASLEDVEEDLWTRDSVNVRVALNVINESDSEDIDEELVLEEDRRNMGMNLSPKQSEVRHVINSNNLAVYAILESHIASSRLEITPWCILGDFNVALNFKDTSVGSSIMDISMREFRECVEEIELMDVPRSGLQFTNGFVGNYAVFQPYGISDHSPAILRIPLKAKFSPKPFKFANVVTTFPRFKEVVNEGWSAQFRGFY
ncbi:RNA-directed DNA polymerase, eukaryota, reverse transcriptase zinc-binding domain protein, partial [Tanacetum coccineum]